MDTRYVKIGLVAAALCLLFMPNVGANGAAASQDTDAIEQLDEIEVIAARIVPQPHRVPMPAPEVGTATVLPPDTPRHRFTPVAPTEGIVPPRLLRDETGLVPGGQRVRYRDVARPKYPRRAREMGWQGTVLLQLEVRADGTVGEVMLRRSSQHDLLDQAALRAAKAWIFAPQTDGGFALSVLVDVPIRFDLTDPEMQRFP